MQSLAGKERRQHPRKLIDVDVYLSCDDKPGRSYKVSVHDLSLSGMAIHPGTLKLNAGDKLCLCLSADTGQCADEHLIEATVMHLHGDFAGICFDSVGIHVLTDIHRLLRAGRNF